MPQKAITTQLKVFISHSLVNLKAAQQVEAALNAAGFDPWLDYSDIRIGKLLGKELQEAIKASEAVVLMSSKAAAASSWVATEVLTAFHLDCFIVPCVLSATELPQDNRPIRRRFRFSLVIFQVLLPQPRWRRMRSMTSGS